MLSALFPHYLIPFALAARQHRREVFLEQEPLPDQLLRSISELFQVLLARRITLAHRRARVAGLFPLCATLGEGEEGPQEAQPLLRRADAGIAQIPSCVRS